MRPSSSFLPRLRQGSSRGNRLSENHRGAAIGLALFILLTTASPVDAEDEIRAADNAMSMEFGATQLNYAETYGGRKLDTENGWLPTATIGASLLASDRAEGVLSNLYLHFEVTGAVGTTDYDGALCTITDVCTPATATTNDRIAATSLQVGRGLPFGPTAMLIPYLQLDYRYWDRNVGGSDDEAYTNWAMLAGLMGQWSAAPHWVFSLSAAAGSTFGANMDDGIANYPLGSALIVESRARLGLRVTDRLELVGTLGYTHFDFGQSPVVTEPAGTFCAAGCIEPHSSTSEVSLTSGVAYHF